MTSTVRRIARRTLLLHSVLLGVVLVVVAVAARQMYRAARDELIGQNQSRQRVLAAETARGIEHHYASILGNLDLARRAQSGASGIKRKISPGVFDRISNTIGRLAASADRRGIGGLIGDVLWNQLDERVAILFSCDQSPDGRAPTTGEVLGRTSAALTPAVVLRRSADWVRSLETASVGPFDDWRGAGATWSGNLVGVPVEDGRAFVALVPIDHVEREFLRPLGTEPAATAWLVDQSGRIMTATRPELVGAESVLPTVDALIDHPFTIGRATFRPSMVATEPVAVGERHWTLFVMHDTAAVDDSLARLFSKTVWSGGIVFVVVTAIVASTAAGLIRSRVRVERMRRDVLTRELSQAREIQLAWLPKARPASGPVEVAAVNHPASHVSGDFYNWFDLPDGRLAVVIGDVTGHGLSAAFLMATAQLLTREATTRTADPGRALAEVNRQLCVQSFNGQFVTILIAVVDPAGRKVHVGTAGHPPPLLVTDGVRHPLPVEPRLMLGVESDAEFATETFDLPPGTGLVMYTDGVIESRSTAGEFFGLDRLTACRSTGRAQAQIDGIVSAVAGFRRPGDLDDDLTIVAVWA